jgi:tetratricopeptide (TPR) repeat protein
MNWSQSRPVWLNSSGSVMAKRHVRNSAKGKRSSVRARKEGKPTDSAVGRMFEEAERFYQTGKLVDAEQAYKALLAVNPQHCPSLVQLAYIALQVGRFSIALNYAKKAVAVDHGEAQAHLVLGKALAELGLAELAESEYTIALQLDNNNDQILNSLGNVYAQQGRFTEAIASFRQAIAKNPDNVLPYYNLASNKRFTLDDPDREFIEDLGNLAQSASREEQIAIRFTLGKIYHDCAEYDQAFEEYQKGNDLKAQQMDYSSQIHKQFIDALIKVQSASWKEKLEGKGSTVDGAIFIVGMPRSGTTLLERLLCRHPQISGVGEPPYIQNLARSSQARLASNLEFPEVLGALTDNVCKELGEEYIQLARQFNISTTHTVDKTPLNFFYLGVILAILPNARLVHNFRDPVDTCLSIYQQLFSGGMPYAYDLEQIGSYYLQYLRIMEHWKRLYPGKILDVKYEDVVMDSEQQLRKVIGFCDLTWDDRCLDDDQKQTVSATASKWQARQAIYQSSVKRWRNYQKHLGPLLEVLTPVLDKHDLSVS